MNRSRIEKLHAKLKAHNLDWMALVPSPSMIYLSGIHSHTSERPIVLFIGATDEPAIIIPTLEAMKAEAAGIAKESHFCVERSGRVSRCV